ncbi:MAG: hypothetical protein Q4F07_00495 [Bacteroidales bacterium]|nr:hypothetical protein [Bacteroidales bacterium]
MMKPIKTLTVILFTAISVLATMAQNSVISPYSRFGYGILSDNATSAQRSMGGVGYAMQSGRQTNVMNPASYAAIDSLTFLFDMGVDFTTLWSKENGHSEKNYGGGLDYITLQVPIGKHMGASVGLLPYGSTGYSFGSKINNGATSRSGSGSLNQLYLGFAGNPFKGFYVGFNFAYLFGTIVNQDYVVASIGSTSLFERQMSVRDWRADIGIQYNLPITRQDEVTLGVVYSPRKDLHGNVYGIYYDTSVTPVVPDTVNAGDHRMKGRYSTPESWGAGLNWKHGSTLMVEADFTYQPWSKAKFGAIEHFESTTFADRYRIAGGLQFTPAQRGGYFKRINYRMGAFYNRDYITVRGNNVRDIGVSLGFGFPVPAFKTIVNLGFEYRHRQAYPQALLKENYLNITLGINFNEMWFRKNKLY